MECYLVIQPDISHSWILTVICSLVGNRVCLFKQLVCFEQLALLFLRTSRVYGSLENTFLNNFLNIGAL